MTDSAPELRCDGRYPVPQTTPPRQEPFDVTYRCAKPAGHAGPHGIDNADETPAPRDAEPQTHTINPVTDRCVLCGRNAFNRGLVPICTAAAACPHDSLRAHLGDADSHVAADSVPRKYEGWIPEAPVVFGSFHPVGIPADPGAMMAIHIVGTTTLTERIRLWCRLSHRCRCGAIVQRQDRKRHEDFHDALREFFRSPTAEELSVFKAHTESHPALRTQEHP